MSRRYTVLLQPDPEEGGYTVTVPALPGCVTEGDTLEEALENFAGCAVIISHDRWFLDRVATHLLAFEGNSQAIWFPGNYSEYDEDRRKRLGKAADRPHRITYRKLRRA